MELSGNRSFDKIRQGQRSILRHGGYLRAARQKYRGEAIDSALKFSELLTEHAHVSTIPCECFGIEGYIRLTYTLSIERIREGVERIKTFIEEIK